jgi:hypothetical protein
MSQDLKLLSQDFDTDEFDEAEETVTITLTGLHSLFLLSFERFVGNNVKRHYHHSYTRI